MQHTIVRPDGFQELWLSPITQSDWARGRVIVFGRGDPRARYVAPYDVGEAIVHWALGDDSPSKLEFGGPEPLMRHQAVAVFEAASGRSIRTPHVPRTALPAGMRLLRRARPPLASVMGSPPPRPRRTTDPSHSPTSRRAPTSATVRRARDRVLS
jgi:hypothetical protein